jgi:hypothetical protein
MPTFDLDDIEERADKWSNRGLMGGGDECIEICAKEIPLLIDEIRFLRDIRDRQAVKIREMEYQVDTLKHHLKVACGG